MLSDLRQDLRYSARQLIKTPGFAIVAILTLAIGIGATTAIFSIVKSVALEPLPFPDSDRLVEIRQVLPDKREFAPLMETVEELQEQSTVFESVAAFTGMHGNLTGVDYPVRIFGHAVTINYFSTLGIQPLIGRTFLPEEGIEGKSNVVILNHAYWLSQFNGSESVLNQKVLLNDQPFTVIGVMPPRFCTTTGQMSSPKAFSPLVANTVTDSTRYLREVIGRLKPGVTIEQVQAEFDVLAKGLAASNPDLWKDLRLRVVPMLDYQVGGARPTLYILLGAVGFLLLIACVNVANLLLARSSGRQREIALRAALGASRTRVVRQLLVESVLLAVIGGTLGTIVAYWSMDVLLSFAPVDLPRLDEVHLDGLALLFSCGVTMLTGIGFGLVPALQATKVDLTLALKEGGRSAGDGRQRARLRSTLVVAEVALALVLLVGAGLLTRTYANLQKVDLGYDGDVIHTTRIMLLKEQYPDDKARIAFTDRALVELSARPELVASAFTTGLPYFGTLRSRFDIEEKSVADASQLPIAALSSVTPDFFKVMGMHLVSGRLIDARDRENTPRIALIGESVARQFFPNQNPVGKRIALVFNNAPREWREVVGVVSDIRMDGPAQEIATAIYVPFCQLFSVSHIKPVVRIRKGAPNPGRIVAAAMQKVDPGMPVEENMGSLAAFDGYKVAPQKFSLFLIGVFSVVALFLAALGIYGVMSYTVNQRTNEIGVRMALGARREDILRLVFVQSARLVGLGLIAGVIGAVAASRLLASLLYNVSPNDPQTFIVIASTLALVAALASYLPARRATKVDPMVALRSE